MNGLVTRFADSDASPGYLLWRVTNAWQRAVRAALAPHELTHVQFVLLATLAAAQPSELTQRELANSAVMDVMMTSQVVRALEDKGLVRRSPHPSDRRAMVISPTAAGTALVNDANAAVEGADEAFFAGLGADGVSEFTSLLADLSSGQERRQ